MVTDKTVKRYRWAVALAVIGIAMVTHVGTAASASPSLKKSIWGPAAVNGQSQFPIYHHLGVGIYQTALSWDQVAPSRPADPTNPEDPAYHWPTGLRYAIRQARMYGIRVSVRIMFSPPWANGGRSREWAPRPADFADFATAAARRYRLIRYWMIWGEPSRQPNFRPLPPNRPRGPRVYSRILDAAYGALKRVRASNVVIGGNTYTSGDVRPLQYIRAMRLPNGRRPRLDMYGHNPFTGRRPSLRGAYRGDGNADFSDLDTLAGWLDRYFGRPQGRPIKLFLSEFFVPSDHANHTFAFHVDRRTQADWLGAALRITRRSSRIYTLGWLSLYDEAPGALDYPLGLETNWGLLDWRGRPKPSYAVYKRG